LSKRQPFGFRIPFNPRGGGCGASMRYKRKNLLSNIYICFIFLDKRSPVIGLRYHKPEQKQNCNNLLAI
jgi:hypothetical protein